MLPGTLGETVSHCFPSCLASSLLHTKNIHFVHSVTEQRLLRMGLRAHQQSQKYLIEAVAHKHILAQMNAWLQASPFPLGDLIF